MKVYAGVCFLILLISTVICKERKLHAKKGNSIKTRWRNFFGTRNAMKFASPILESLHWDQITSKFDVLISLNLMLLVVSYCTICCHSLSLVVPLVVICYHSLSFVVTCVPLVATHCTTRYPSLSLNVSLACLFITILMSLSWVFSMIFFNDFHESWDFPAIL